MAVSGLTLQWQQTWSFWYKTQIQHPRVILFLLFVSTLTATFAWLQRHYQNNTNTLVLCRLVPVVYFYTQKQTVLSAKNRSQGFWSMRKMNRYFPPVNFLRSTCICLLTRVIRKVVYRSIYVCHISEKKCMGHDFIYDYHSKSLYVFIALFDHKRY